MTYNSYLAKYSDKIVKQWKRGKSITLLSYEYGCSSFKIRQVLVEKGCLQKNVIPRTPVVPPRRYFVNWAQMFTTNAGQPTLINLGRPIDMGGPRGVWLERDPWSDL